DRIAAVRTGHRAARGAPSGGRGRPQSERLRLPRLVQSGLPRWRDGRRLDIAVALRAEPGPDRADDRKSAQRPDLETDAPMQRDPHRLAACGIRGRLAGGKTVGARLRATTGRFATNGAFQAPLLGRGVGVRVRVARTVAPQPGTLQFANHNKEPTCPHGPTPSSKARTRSSPAPTPAS